MAALSPHRAIHIFWETKHDFFNLVFPYQFLNPCQCLTQFVPLTDLGQIVPNAPAQRFLRGR